MIPIRDNMPSLGRPWVTWGILATCSAVFFHEITLGPLMEGYLDRWGLVPATLFEALHGSAPLAPPLLATVTCLFLHGGWLHILGNLWFLHIFGDNVEDALGHLRFAFLYLACGVLASLTHAFFSPTSELPLVGASGAISGVMGAYILFFPGARVLTLVPLGIFSRLVPLPAVLFLGFWFLLQFAQGVGSAGAAEGVAFWAHVGGFLAGMALSLPLLARSRRRRTFRIRVERGRA